MRNRLILSLVLLAGLVTGATAAETLLDPIKDRAFGAKYVQCGICHGVQGTPRVTNFPIIWGQQENYLAKQMKAYASGERQHEVMAWVSKLLTPQELTSAVAHMAKRKWPERTASLASPPPSGIDACTTCHAAKFLGTAMAPRLAGQSQEYLVETMRQYSEGERKDPIMVPMMKKMSAADREAMARYLSGL